MPVPANSSRNMAAAFRKLDLEGLKALNEQADIPVSTITLDDEDVKWVQRCALSHLQAVQQRDAKVRWVDQGYGSSYRSILTAYGSARDGRFAGLRGIAVLCLFHAPPPKRAAFASPNLSPTRFA